MPRLLAPPLLGLALIACLPADAVREIAAAAAGTLYEAAPFLLASELAWGLRFKRLRGIVALGGCGCRGAPLPGALALPAFALCWLSFGPAVALVRAGAAATVAARHRSGAPTPDTGVDVLSELGALGWCAAGAAALKPVLPAFADRPVLGFATGLLLGVLAPCATAGVALAAGVAHHAATASGILATSGILVVRKRRPPRDSRGAFLARVGLAAALLSLALHGPGGLVNPRLVPLAAAGAVAAFAGPFRRTQNAAALLVPAVMFAGLAMREPPSPPVIDQTQLADAYPGQQIEFTGRTWTHAGTTTLSRFAIACCRLDATALSIRLDRELAVPDGAWARVRGTLHEHAGTLVLTIDASERVAPPPDPFVYL